jgi:hypothetical protein
VCSEDGVRMGAQIIGTGFMHKFLFLVKIYVYKVCNPTILNLSIVKEKFRIVGLQAQINFIRWVCVYVLYVYFVVTRTGFLLLFVFYLIGCKIGFVGPFMPV